VNNKEALQRRNAISNFFKEGGNNIMAGLSGIGNIPLDAAKYAEHLGTYLEGKVFDRNAQYTQDQYNKTNAYWNKPDFLPDVVNKHRAQLAQDNPIATSIGEILGTGGLGGLSVKAVVNLAKNGRARKYISRLPIFNKREYANRREAIAAGLAAGTLAEYGKEPVLDNYVFSEKE